MTTAAASRPTGRRRPRWLAPLTVVGILLAVTLTGTWLSPGGGHTGDLDPANPGPSGAQGLAHVLRDHGVEVTIVRSQRDFLDQSIGGATTVAVTGPKGLSSRTAGVALAHASSAASVVLLDPDPEVTGGMGLPVNSHLADLSRVRATCQGTQIALIGADFHLAQAGRAYTPRANTSPTTTCFADKAGGGSALVALPASGARPPLTLLGDDSLITNGAILDSDNAAIALRLFGQSDRLLWYVPSVADIAAGDSSSRSITPPWFEPGLTLGASAVLLLCLWQGRRLGRLVTEPLPVVVRAVETTESRGRMYRKSRDRTRALAVLQQATRRRLASYLGLSGTCEVSALAAASAAVSGRGYQDVLHILDSPVAPDDSSLLERANALSALEKEVRAR